MIADGREGRPCRGRHRQDSCFGYVDVSMNKFEERSQKSKVQASRNPPHDRIDTCGPSVAAQAGVRVYERGWPQRWRLLRSANAMVPILGSDGYQRRDQNVRTSVAERSGVLTY